MTALSKMNVYDALSNLMQQYSTRLSPFAKTEMENLLSYCLEGIDKDSEKFLVTLFIKALKKRLGTDSTREHIYLQNYEIPQIELFDILIDKFPFVKISQQIINEAIIEEIKGLTEVTIMDIGIGLGTQMKNIIELAKNLPNLRKMTIVGIEPFADALEKAGSMIESYRKNMPFEIEFVAIHDFSENVDFNEIAHLSSPLIVNASLALHHIPAQEQRVAIIEKIKRLNPLAFILTEPNSNHFEADFYQRFQNCYSHFYHIFQVIDQIEIESKDKNALKLFFGREIDDIIGNPDSDRYEKHEPATHWIEKLKDTGFQLKTDFLRESFENNTCLRVGFHSEGFLGLTYDKETVLSIIYAN